MPRLVVPIRSFRTGFARLRGEVDDGEVLSIARRLARHVVHTAVTVGDTLVVTDDDEVAELASSLGADIERDESGGAGLNAAARLGTSGADSWLVVHGDLPLLHQFDLEEALKVLDSGRSALAPTHDGGTSLVAGWGAFTFRYGPGSFQRHLSAMPSSQVLIRRGLLLDVDTAADARGHLA